MTVNELLLAAHQSVVKSKGTLRYGQCAFNILADERKDLADQVRGTDMDPFYCESIMDPKWERFLEFLGDNL